LPSLQVLSWYPRIVLFPAFADNDTVAQIIAMARPLLQPSKLGTASLTEEQKANQPVRVVAVSVAAAAAAVAAACIVYIRSNL
jgi:hypothetical protein